MEVMNFDLSVLNEATTAGMCAVNPLLRLDSDKVDIIYARANQFPPFNGGFSGWKWSEDGSSIGGQFLLALYPDTSIDGYVPGIRFFAVNTTKVNQSPVGFEYNKGDYFHFKDYPSLEEIIALCECKEELVKYLARHFQALFDFVIEAID